MQALGIRRGDHVGILMGNDERWLALFYGAALIGAVTVPVNTRFKAAEIDFCLKQSAAKALFYAGQFLENDYESMVYGIQGIHKINLAKDKTAGEYRPVAVKPSDLLLIQFTSGTTAH